MKTKLNRKNLNYRMQYTGLAITDQSEYVGPNQPRKNIHFAVKDKEGVKDWKDAKVLDTFKTLKEAWDFVRPIYEERTRQRAIARDSEIILRREKLASDILDALQVEVTEERRRRLIEFLEKADVTSNIKT